MRSLEVVPGRCVAPLELGMTIAEAEAAFGPAEERMRSFLHFETLWWLDAALQADFDGVGRMGRVGVTWTPRHISARVGDLDLFRTLADDVSAQLDSALGAGERDERGYQHAWPATRFSIWRIPPPADESDEFRGGRYWTAAFSWTDEFVREAADRAAVRRTG